MMKKYTPYPYASFARRGDTIWAARGGQQFPLYYEATDYLEILISRGAASVDDIAADFHARGTGHTLEEIVASVSEVVEDLTAEGVLVLVN